MNSKIYTAPMRVELNEFMEKILSWSVEGAAASLGGQRRADGRNWSTCPLLRLCLSTAFTSGQRRAPSDTDFLIFLKLCPKEKIAF